MAVKESDFPYYLLTTTVMERNMVSFKTKCSRHPILFRLSLFIVLYVILFLPALTFAFCKNKVNPIYAADVHGHVLILPDNLTFWYSGWDKVVSTPGLTYESNIDLVNIDESFWARWGGLKGWVWTEPYSEIYAPIDRSSFLDRSVECGKAASSFAEQVSTLLRLVGTPPSSCGNSELVYWAPIMVYVVEPRCVGPEGGTKWQKVSGIFGFYAVYLQPPNSPPPPPPPSPPPIEGSCDIRVDISYSEVWPQGTGNDDKTTSTIMITPTGTTPAEGCTINFRVEAVENSGGHSHDGDRQTGNVFFSNLTIPGSSSNPVYAIYSSLDVSGQERIIMKVNEKEVYETIINVRVSGLEPLESRPNLLLWGGTAEHKLGDNNYGTAYTRDTVYYAVEKYVRRYNNALNTIPNYYYLAVIDMSLPWGGLFDINGGWTTPHELHRVGRSIDFSKYYKDSRGNNIQVVFYDDDGNVYEVVYLINDDKLDEYFSERYCIRMEKKIGKIHYECPGKEVSWNEEPSIVD